MKHPAETLKAEYSQLLSVMTVRPDSAERVHSAASMILKYRDRFEEVSKINGVPVVFMGPSFYREATLDFRKNPAQGWWLSSKSKIIPHNGPFPDWKSAALAAYSLNGLDRVGAENWTWELICFYGEMFNGFGYRDNHQMHTPYLWGGTNIQTKGKYVEDGKFDPDVMDTQLGIIPIAKHMIKLAPDLNFMAMPSGIPTPAPSGLARGGSGRDTRWIQSALADLGFDLVVDGNYGKHTRQAVHDFEVQYGLKVDGGYAGPEVMAALERAIAALKADQERPVV